MSWESPIEIIVNQMESAWMDETFRVIQKVGINVDRNELIKALQYDRNQYEKGYEDGKKEAAQRWIPVTERLPEHEDHVLCCTATAKGRKNIVIGYYCRDLERWASGMNSNVIAWMELPEPYKEPEDPSHPCADSVMMGERRTDERPD